MSLAGNGDVGGCTGVNVFPFSLPKSSALKGKFLTNKIIRNEQSSSNVVTDQIVKSFTNEYNLTFIAEQKAKNPNFRFMPQYTALEGGLQDNQTMLNILYDSMTAKSKTKQDLMVCLPVQERNLPADK